MDWTSNRSAGFGSVWMIQGEQGVVTQNNKTAHHHIYKSQSLVLKPRSSIFQYIVTIRQYKLQWGYYQTCKNLAKPLVDSWHYREKQQGGGWCCRDRRTYLSYRLQHARGMIPRPRSHSESWGGKKQVNWMSVGTKNTSITFRCLARRPACLDKSWRERGERTKTQTPRQSTAPPVWAAIKDGRTSREKVLIMTIYTEAQGENWRPCGT